MAVHTWNSLTFGTEVQVNDSGDIREQADQSAPGVDGVEVTDKGWRGRVIEISGRHEEDSIQSLRSWVNSVNAARATISTLSLYGGDDELQFTRLESFRAPILRRTSAGRFAVRFQALFRQLRPNSAT